MKIVKLIRPLYDAATKQGWTVTTRNCNHLRWTSPSGAVVFTSSTPSDHKAFQRIKRDLRHNGLAV